MGGLGLRAKLLAMGASAAPSAPAPARGGLTVRVTRAGVPESVLKPPHARALKLIGVERDWPGTERLLFLDTETTGLSGGAGTLAFLVGLGYVENGELVTEQFLMGDYSDEPELLHKVAERMRGFDVLVTFNGRAFDLPMLDARRTLMRMDALPQLTHIDLLPPARRLWKKRLGSVRLSALEEHVLNEGRVDDLPGSEAPRRFFDYLKTGDRSLLEPVLEHNRRDVCAMASLLASLLNAYAGPSERQEPADLFSLGRALERGGDRSEAVRCYHMAALPRPITGASALHGQRASDEALFALGILLKRMGEYARAAKAFDALAGRGRMGAAPMVELAKLYEHRAHDYQSALNWTERALAAEKDAHAAGALERRRARLNGKILRYGGCKHHGL